MDTPINQSMTQESLPSEQTSTASLPPGKTSLPLMKLMVLLGGILILSGLIGGAYLLGMKSAANPQQVSTITPTAVPTAIPTTVPTVATNPTANWPTYTDTQDGVSIQYPTGWSYDTALFVDDKLVAFGPGGYKIPLQTEASVPIALTVRKESFDAVVKRWTDFMGTANQRPISAGGLSGYYNGGTDTQPGPGQGMTQGEFILNDNGKAIEVFYTVYQGVDYKDIASQMLQTIKLTN